MNVQLLCNDRAVLETIDSFFVKKGDTVLSQSSVEGFFRSCVRNPSNLFFIQADFANESFILNMIKDLRTYFGALPLIILITKKNTPFDITNYLGVGADNVFEPPYDLTILEDFISQSLKLENFHPILYRNVPSGGSPIRIKREIDLQQISTEGIEFESSDLIVRGTVFDFKIGTHLDTSNKSVKCKVMSSKSVDDKFSYYAEFFDLSEELSREIRFKLKHSKA